MEAELDAGAAPDAVDGLNSPHPTVNLRSKHNCEDTLLSICRSYGISSELYKPFCAKDGWKAPPEASNAVCVFEAMLESGVRFPLHEFYNRILSHFNLAPGQLVPKAWRRLVGFVLLCEEVGVTPMASVFRYYFKLCSNGNGWYQFKANGNHLFNLDCGFYINAGWKERFFYLQCLTAENPWRCPRKFGEPGKEAYDLPDLNDTAWTVIYELEAAKDKKKTTKSISLKKLLMDKSRYNQDFPVLPPLHEQVNSETNGNDDDDATPNAQPAKRQCLPATAATITPPSQWVIGSTSSAPPGFAPVISPRSTIAGNDELSRQQMMYQMIHDVFMDLHQTKQNLASEQAGRAKALGDLEAEQSKVRKLTGELQAVQGERDKALIQLKEMRAKVSVYCAAQAEHTTRVRQHQVAEAELASKVRHLTKLLETKESNHVAKVQLLESDLEAAQAEGAKALGQLKEMRAEFTKAHVEHTDRVCQLRKDLEAVHATKVNSLMEEHKEAEANLQRLAEVLKAEKAKHTAELNAIRAQCSQMKAAIKYINVVTGVAGSKVAAIRLPEESAGVAGDSKLIEEPAAIKQVELVDGEKTHACETDPVHSPLRFESPINKNKMDDAMQVLIEDGTKPASRTENTVAKTAAASEAVEELVADAA